MFLSSLVKVTRSVSTGILRSALSIWRLTLQPVGRSSLGKAWAASPEASPSSLSRRASIARGHPAVGVHLLGAEPGRGVHAESLEEVSEDRERPAQLVDLADELPAKDPHARVELVVAHVTSAGEVGRPWPARPP